MYVIAVCDDLYDKAEVETVASNLEPYLASMRPIDVKLFRNWQQDPTGWAPTFFQPNPYSTAGNYVIYWSTAGLQGSPTPYVGKANKVRLSLGGESTQQTSTVIGYSSSIIVTDAELFIKSLRALLAIKDLQVNPDLLNELVQEVRKQKEAQP